MNPISADWGNFFVAEVGAAAALAGLVAVAISINLARILAFPQLPARAAEALAALTAIFVLASLGLLPGQGQAWFGAETVVIGFASLAISTRAQFNAWRQSGGASLGKRVARAAVTAVSLGALIVGGALLIGGDPVGLYAIAVGVILTLVSGVWNAWVLLVEILR